MAKEEAEKWQPKSMTNDLIDAVGDQLRAKIGNKFQAATFLGGLSAAILGIQLTVLLQPQGNLAPPFIKASMILMFAALCFFLYGAIRLDALTMPKMFWNQEPFLGRNPPKTKVTALQPQQINLGDLEALWERMIIHWTFLVGVGTLFAALSLLLILAPVFIPIPDDQAELSRYLRIGALAVPIGYVIWFRLWRDRKPLSTD